MDNTHDNLDIGKVLNIGEAAKSLWYKVKKPVPKSPEDIARAEAQKISDAGGYLTLTPEQKALIPVPEYIKAQAQSISQQYGGAATVDDLVNAKPIPATAGQLVEKLKAYLPHILIGTVVIWMLFKFVKK